MQQSVKANSDGNGNPWYKEPWGWFVFAPLFIVVFVTLTFVYIAVKGSDDVVKDRVTKNGKLYEKDFRAENYARSQNIDAEVAIVDDVVSVKLDATNPVDLLFDDLVIVFEHPQKKARDIELVLNEVSPRRYQASLPVEISGRWYLVIQASRKGSKTESPVSTKRSDDFANIFWQVKREQTFNRTQLP